MKQPLKLFVLCLLPALLVSGCAMVGPDYQMPSAPLQNDWLEYEDPRLDSKAPVVESWWKTAFNDPILNRLVDTTLSQNLSLRSAGLRVLQARQQLAIAIGSQYPQQQQINGKAGIAGVSSSPSYEIYDLGFNLSWEADVWGRFSRQIESASAAFDVSLGSYDGVMVSLIAEVAQTYLTIRTTEQRLAVAKHNFRLQRESLRITTVKYESGEVSVLDVDQAKTLFYNTQSTLASLELSLQQFKNSLAILLGQPPHDMGEMLGPVQPVPTVSPAIAVGMPQNLIRRRPDIRVAKRQLAAQSAQIGFAVSDLYPQFSLGGSIGSSISTEGSLNFGDLFSPETTSYNLFGGFQWNIFQYGRIKSNVRLQDAIFQQLLEDYRQTVLQAQGEVENAIVAFLKSQQQLAGKYGRATFLHGRFSSQQAPTTGILGFEELLANVGIYGGGLLLQHFHQQALGETQRAMQLVDDAQKKGLKVSAEVYPYNFGATIVGADYLHPDNYGLNMGRTYKDIIEIATLKPLTKERYDELVKSAPGTAVMFYGAKEEDLYKALAHPGVIVGSDAFPLTVTKTGKMAREWDTPYEAVQGHPRAAGCNAIVLRMVREKKLMPLMTAIGKMSYLPAMFLEENGVAQMAYKGRIQVGADADITIFNPKTVKDNSTTKKAGLPSTGIPYVIVNGTVVVKDSKLLKSVYPVKAIRLPVM